jgi:hypothetical protein
MEQDPYHQFRKALIRIRIMPRPGFELCLEQESVPVSLDTRHFFSNANCFRFEFGLFYMKNQYLVGEVDLILD